MAKTQRGRVSIFRGKANGVRLQGVITKNGAAAFEMARIRLRALYLQVMGQTPTTVSDADVIEYLARGDHGTQGYLRGEARKAGK